MESSNGIGRIRLGYSAANTSQRLHSGKELRTSPFAFGQIRARLKTNIECLTRILGFNVVHKIRLFRIGTHFISRPFDVDYKQLLQEFGAELEHIKALCEHHDFRLTIHGITTSLGHPDAVQRERAVKHLEYCSDVLDAVGSSDSVIIQHLGGTYTHRADTMRRVVETIGNLPDQIRNRLLLENDERWGVSDVISVVRQTGCGFVYDVFHHKCYPFDLAFTSDNIQTALKAAKNTAAKIGKTPKLHISSQNPLKDVGGHADLIEYRDYARLRNEINEAGFRNVDIMLEADLHEQAVLSLLPQIQARKPKWSVMREGILY